MITLLEDVINSYDNSIEPKKEIIEKINNLVEIIPENELIKRDLIHTINIISTSNKEKCLLKFENIVNNHWKKEFNKIFFTILKNTNVNNVDLLLEMFKLISNDDQYIIIDTIFNSNLVNLEMKTCGIFLSKLYLTNSISCETLKKGIEKLLDYKPYMIINIYITLISNDNFDLICKDILNNLKKMNLNTSTSMLLYDLEDLCTEKCI